MKYTVKVEKGLQKYLIDVLQSYCGPTINCSFIIKPDETQEIEWTLEPGAEVPRYRDIYAEAVKLKQTTELELSKTEYQRLRKAEYDKLNQDEMRFDDLINGTTTWQDAILAIKSKYPKPKVK